MSRQNDLILSIVQTSPGHPTADQVYETAKQIIPNISLGTVYRNLGILAEQKRIRKVSVPGQPDHYDRTLYEHGHMICSRCGYVEDIPVSILEGKNLEDKLGFEILAYELTIRYICPVCRSNEKENDVNG